MFGFRHGRLGSAGTRTLIQRAIASLRARGSDAHLWLPGGDVKTYGPELVTGQVFTANSANTVAAINGCAFTGAAIGSNASAGYALNVGSTYTVVYVISGLTGGATYIDLGGGSNAIARNANGTYTETKQCLGNTNLYFGASSSGTTATIVATSVKEITSITPTITNGLTTGNYLESTGNSVATVDNPTGLVLDALGTKITKTVPLFDGYNSTLTSQTLPATATSTTNGNFGFVWYGGYHELGRVYEYTITWSGNTANRGLSVDGANGALFSSAQSGTKTFICRQANAPLYIYAVSALSGDAFTVTSFSVREVTGIHLTQGTTANKPLLRRGLWNLLWPSDPSSAWWQFFNISGTATRTGNILTFGGSAGDRVLRSGGVVTSVAGQIYTSACLLSGSGDVRLISFDGNGGTVSTTNITLTATPTIYVSTFASVASGTNCGCGIYNNSAGTAGASFTFHSAAIFQGTLTAQQIIDQGGIPVTTTAAASNPDAGKYSWAFDGSNDSLLTGNLGITNACTIVIAGRVDSLASVSAMFCEATNGVLVYALTNGQLIFELTGGGGTLAFSAAGEVVAGVPFVLTFRLSGGTAVIRKNGVQRVSSTTAFTFSATTGARIGNSFASNLPSNGSFGSILAMPVALTDAECLLVERMAAANFPNGPVF